jgi:hypothetical protein
MGKYTVTDHKGTRPATAAESAEFDAIQSACDADDARTGYTRPTAAEADVARESFMWCPDYDCRIGDRFKLVDDEKVYEIRHIAFTGDFIAEAVDPKLGDRNEIMADLRGLDNCLREGTVVAVSGCEYKTVPGPTPLYR